MNRIELPQVSLCSGCGNCCRHIGLPPFEVANPDLGPQKSFPTPGGLQTEIQLRDMDKFDRMPAELRAEHAKMVSELKEDPSGKPCAWLADDGRCKNYEFRPAVCEVFVPGSHECEGIRRGAKCVWIGDAPVEVWKNPRHERRYVRPERKPTRREMVVRWLRRNIGYVDWGAHYWQVGVNVLPLCDIDISSWAGIRVRRRVYLTLKDEAKPA